MNVALGSSEPAAGGIAGTDSAVGTTGAGESSTGIICSNRRRVADGAITASPRCTVRIASSSCSGGVSFNKKPLAPARTAEYTYSSISKVVSMIMRTRSSSETSRSPSRSRIRRAASRPSQCGMRTSMRMTCGARPSETMRSKTSMAARPSSASMTTCRSGWELTSMLKPPRTRRWSSTSITRIGWVVCGAEEYIVSILDHEVVKGTGIRGRGRAAPPQRASYRRVADRR